MAKNSPAEDGSRGTIILTSGFASKTSRRGQAAIGSCFGGIDSMTLPMARDLGSLGVRVATISPGMYLSSSCTQSLKLAYNESHDCILIAGLFSTPLTSSFTEEVVDYFTRAQAFPYRFGHPKEYSDLVLHIIQNKMINGEVLSVDAGLIVPSY